MGQLKLWARVANYLDSSGGEVWVVFPLARGLRDIARLWTVNSVYGEEGEGPVHALDPVLRRYHWQLPLREEVVFCFTPERVQEHQVQRSSPNARPGSPGVPGAEKPIQPVYLLPGAEPAHAHTVADGGRKPSALYPASDTWRW